MSRDTVAGYWPGWLTCAVCGLTGPDVVLREADRKQGRATDCPACPDVARCERLMAGESLGGRKWDVSKVPE